MSNESELSLISVRCINCNILSQFETAHDIDVGDEWDQQDECTTPECTETRCKTVKVVKAGVSL